MKTTTQEKPTGLRDSSWDQLENPLAFGKSFKSHGDQGQIHLISGPDDVADELDGNLAPQPKMRPAPHGHHLKRSVSKAPLVQSTRLIRAHGDNHR